MITMVRRHLGRRSSDFWRPVIVALVAALATNVAQAGWNAVSAADERAYWSRYVGGFVNHCLHRENTP